MRDGVIGRDAELGAADRALDLVADGAVAVVIEGEPGIGKSTVWEAVASRAHHRGLRVLSARPAEAEATLSFSGLADLMGNVIDECYGVLPAAMGRAMDAALLRSDQDTDAVAPRELGMAVRTCLDHLCRDGSIVLAIDDPGWLDPATERALLFALRRIPDRPIGLLLASRTVGDGARHLLDLIDAVPADRITTLRLGGLSLAGLHHLIERRLGETLSRPALTRLEQASGGNPFLALEVMRSVQASGRSILFHDVFAAPADVQRVVADRFAALTPETRTVLRAIAVMGRPDMPSLTTTVPEVATAPVIDPAVDAGLIVIDEGLIRFSHPIYRSAIYGMATPAQRRVLHRRLAEVATDPEEAAHHLALATAVPDESVAGRLESAAETVAARGATEAAASLLEHARRLTPKDRTADLDRRSISLGRFLWEIGEVARSRAILDEVVARLAPGHQRALVLSIVAVQAAWTDGPETAINICREALIDARGDAVLEASIHLRIAYEADRDLALASHHAEEATRILERAPSAHDDLTACALLLGAERRLLMGAGFDADGVSRARRLLPPLPDPAARPLGLNPLGIARERDWLLHAYTDDLSGARDALISMYRYARDTGLDRALPIQLSDLAELECWLGDLPAARLHATECIEVTQQTGRTPYAVAAGNYASAVVAAYEGDLVAARGTVEDYLREQGKRGGGPIDDRLQALLGLVALVEGHAEDAVAHFARVEAALRQSVTRFPGLYRFRGDQIEALTLSGDLVTAHDRLAEMEAGALIAPGPWLAAVGSRCRALLAAAAGELGIAIEHLEHALIAHAQLEMPVERGRTLLLKGQLHRRRKEKRAAAETLRDALDVFVRVEASAWAERARRELARVGLRPSSPDELTATEEEVARLAASGMTNRQVADAVVLSPKSIEGVLSRVYGKLGIHSRAELGAHMQQRDKGSHR